MMVLVMLTLFARAEAGTEVFTGTWRLDEAASDPLRLPQPPPQGGSGDGRARSGGGRGQGPPSGGMGGGGGMGGRGGGGGMGGPPSGGGASSGPKAETFQSMRWMVESGEEITLSGSDDTLGIAWFGGEPVSVAVRRRAHKLQADVMGAPGSDAVRLQARWGQGELTVSRDHNGAVFTEHILFPEGNRMVVVLELEPPGSDEPVWFRREYTRQ